MNIFLSPRPLYKISVCLYIHLYPKNGEAYLLYASQIYWMPPKENYVHHIINRKIKDSSTFQYFYTSLW